MNAMAKLAQEQQALLQALMGECDDGSLWPHLQLVHAPLARRGLQAYQANGLALAGRALGAAYPVLAQLIGDESFGPLARHFWRRHPPSRGDVACWGDGLATFLEASPQLVDEPYLGDVARMEWALHQATTAADAWPDPHSFTLLSAADPAEITLTLGAGVFLLASAYPVASIVNAHLLGEPALAEAAALLRTGAAEHALVWRQGFKPRVGAVTAAEHAMLSALQAGNSLEAALEHALECTPAGTPESAAAFSFEHWLGRVVQDGLVTGARRLARSAFQASDPAGPNPFNLHNNPGEHP
ncbi:MAG: DNA-binding domain-containing protein [Polaromonas sp.]|uniref:DNA-binding domain-containing protein n=1 Tax=Polaromonas sp. TaxID=1869339 RepID=UPI0032668A1A